MYFIVNNSLKMGKGKIAAQVGHAIYKLALRRNSGWKRWEDEGGKKIICKALTQEDFDFIIADSTKRNLNFVVITDQGRTQIAAGSRTVIGYAPNQDINYDVKLL